MLFFDTTITSYKANKNKLPSSISNQYDVEWWNWKLVKNTSNTKTKWKQCCVRIANVFSPPLLNSFVIVTNYGIGIGMGWTINMFFFFPILYILKKLKGHRKILFLLRGNIIDSHNVFSFFYPFIFFSMWSFHI